MFYKVAAILSIFALCMFIWLRFDKKEDLVIRGNVKRISVSPDEKLWLVTSAAEIFYSNGIDSAWHYGNPLQEDEELHLFDPPKLERIDFFNKDTAIMTGPSIGLPNPYSPQNYYLTHDGGKSWQLKSYPSSTHVYDICVDKYGHAWLGGSSGEMLYSDDFAQTWKKLNSPYQATIRMSCIYMQNGVMGVAGSVMNQLHMTKDNWTTFSRIPTPFDQQKYTQEKFFADNAVENAVMWKQYLVVQQTDAIFYSDTANINWMNFPVRLKSFEIDKESNTLFAITLEGDILEFMAPQEYHPVCNVRLSGTPIDIQVVNHSVYLLTENHEVFKVNGSGKCNSDLVTSDIKRPQPIMIRQGRNFVWGIEENKIFLGPSIFGEWHEVKQLPFPVYDIRLIDDSTAIVWSSKNENFIYSLKNNELSEYVKESPLKEFLTHGIQSFIIEAGHGGCDGQVNQYLRFVHSSDSVLSSSTLISNENRGVDMELFERNFEEKLLLDILYEMNAHPAKVPSLEDFRMNDDDIVKYRERVDEKSTWPLYSLNDRGINKAFYYAVPQMLDTLSDKVLWKVLSQEEMIWSTSQNWLEVSIINENNDTLRLRRDFFKDSRPYHVPWKLEFKGTKFDCYHLAFSGFLQSFLHEKSYHREYFGNDALLMAIADYLWERQR